jgi:hypothetical protein
MISKLVHGAHRLDAWLKLNVGRPYTLILSVGLVIAMIDGVSQLSHTLSEGGEILSGHLLTFSVTLVFQAALLINLLAQWHEHRSARENRKAEHG